MRAVIHDVLTGGRSAGVVPILGLVAICCAVYGAVVGVFGAMHGRPVMMLLTAAKLPLALGLTFVLSLPNFWVVNSLLGLRDDMPQALGALARMAAAGALALASLSPVTLLWYASSSSYAGATMFNMLMFSVAGWVSVRGLQRLYAPLIAKNRMHGRALLAWKLGFAFICLQTFWLCRPFLGDPGAPLHVFRESAFGNVYTELGTKIWEAL